MPYLQILNDRQLDLIKGLDFLGGEVYLAGGTGLALQLGHRTSLDFDFYSKIRFDPQLLAASFQEKSKDLKINSIVKDTLILTVDGVSFSLFYYPYKMIGKKVKVESINVASIQDIAAMKLVAVAMRGKRRDFIDIYYLLKKYSLKDLLGFVKTKYPSFEEMMVLKGLIYFEDAEDEDLARGIKVLAKHFSWEDAKKKILQEVKRYQLAIIRK
ncbi:hypothetical protein A2V56_04085 [Candidatus Woesebacteria bacterium RBG_19FT_COMBO_42_9]|uniref:Nucleotidyl transferase AbiEii toxin, Type IV TA system n=1 Tax=Candidatus Woesebacteria bacterium RBG_16_42_24 TaxID=1802485 RepID=A0A1F7XKH0_9BACT|nr:MAG: hypothetical protein A2V97_01280 [Candidatus Woesebacteria bacterium RBG_16_42_24]OGM17799.1 MAG: hypothetical protein A2V56_04085 [Candidatus Woesebacteria bacterium RBG_19FT_COMBO_42_9]OGM68075.1 MAG: hypothetical protein A2985_03325 [Candidatus Woesebacteria bacterium RIFCSPLOWO2_01_FULL_43_11]